MCRSWLHAERADGAGRLLAAAVKGIGNGLHSRADALLKCLLQEDLLTPAHFKSHQVSSNAHLLSPCALANAHVLVTIYTPCQPNICTAVLVLCRCQSVFRNWLVMMSIHITALQINMQAHTLDSPAGC